MIRIERDPAFWRGIINHPQVEHVMMGMDGDIGPLVESPNVTPYAAEHGGFLLARADSFGRVFELHTMFTPEGWGREAYGAAVEMLNAAFVYADMIITHVTPHIQSRPPKTFRFKQAGEMRESAFGPVQLWILTQDAWANSPAGRRKCQL